ncbi:5984_t:CDS:1 [Paraglomus brasilianum]|uniref:5984_t:CDS:1 n=1 Tax=Paraglomus brasilianum TaxID=144538 RepID=A0A9N9B5N7_9GLOM|nr:5984_t:CDS:1 [Paraglomus brasilianum]
MLKAISDTSFLSAAEARLQVLQPELRTLPSLEQLGQFVQEVLTTKVLFPQFLYNEISRAPMLSRTATSNLLDSYFVPTDAIICNYVYHATISSWLAPDFEQ